MLTSHEIEVNGNPVGGNQPPYLTNLVVKLGSFQKKMGVKNENKLCKTTSGSIFQYPCGSTYHLYQVTSAWGLVRHGIQISGVTKVLPSSKSTWGLLLK